MSQPVFISYSTDDISTATAIRDHLEAQRISCWMAPRDIAPGLEYGSQIIDAIEGCTVLVLVLSESSNRSRFVLNEVERAVSKGKIIIPLRVHEVQPSRSLEFFISNAQWIDGWTLPAVKPMDALMQAIRNHLSEPIPSSNASNNATSNAPSSHSQALDAAPLPAIKQNNLPHQLTPFVGREAELSALDRLLSQPEVRLVTILGPGGMGKTRLSLAVAERHLADARFEHGVYFVALAPLSDAQYIVFALAEALSIPLQSGGVEDAPLQQMLRYLRTRELLLVFDNFEHLLDGANLVAQILQAASQVKVVVTSRERLRVAGEHLFPIQGLDTQHSEEEPTEGRSAATQLFLQHARQIDPDLEFTNQELAQVASICKFVGGMPLGIELAAAWIEVLSPQEIAAEIQQSLDFLAAQNRGGQGHHSSIRAVFDSTWQRLEPTEQDAFACLSIFRGGFTREAAEQVAGASLRLLSTLAGKSLIQHNREQGRYTVHELLRQFGEEKLKALPPRLHEAYEGLCTYYSHFLQRQEARLKGREQAASLNDIETEIENIRTLWHWATAHRQIEALDRSLESVWLFYVAKSWLQEGNVLLKMAADMLQMDEPAGRDGVVLGRTLARQGSMIADTNEEIGGANSEFSATTLYERSIEILNKLGARAETGLPLLCLSAENLLAENYERALHFLNQAFAVFTEEHDLWQLSFVQLNRSYIYYFIDDLEQALEACRQGIAICEEIGNLRNLAWLLGRQAMVLTALGEYDEAQKAADKSLVTSRGFGERRVMAFSLFFAGNAAWQMGDFVLARQHAEASSALCGELGLLLIQQDPLWLLGMIESSLGNLQKARVHFSAILQANLESNTLNGYRMRETLMGMGTVLAQEGRRAQAAELFDFVLHHPLTHQESRGRAVKLRSELTPDVPDLPADAIRPAQTLVVELLSQSG